MTDRLKALLERVSRLAERLDREGTPFSGREGAARTQREDSAFARISGGTGRPYTRTSGEEGYRFGDSPDAARYLYSDEYITRISNYLEADARRYSAEDLEEGK